MNFPTVLPSTLLLDKNKSRSVQSKN